MLRYFKFTNGSGQSITYRDHGQHKFLGKIKGMNQKPIKPLNAKGYEQQGVYNYGVNAGPRTISFEAMLEGTSISTMETLEEEIIDVLNPENVNQFGIGRIDVETLSGEKYYIEGFVAVHGDIERVSETYNETYTIFFTCPKPDWLSPEAFTLKMATLVGGLSFPFTFPITFAEIGTGGEIEYTGQNPASIVFDFRVKEGSTSMTNPKVSDPLGNSIEISKTLNIGERILVDTNPDKPSATFIDIAGVESDAWDDIVWKPTFFQLIKGTNIFTFTATGGDPEVYATYRLHYAGIVG